MFYFRNQVTKVKKKKKIRFLKPTLKTNKNETKTFTFYCSNLSDCNCIC